VGLTAAVHPGLLTEQTSPQANSEYGAQAPNGSSSLQLERGVCERFVPTLYGPGQDKRKPQGIISHLSRCLIHRRHVSIYVPLDTRRDYPFVDDCAHQIAASLARIEQSRSILKIFASEQLTSKSSGSSSGSRSIARWSFPGTHAALSRLR
jgi:UDP-glucose 4-epimerase